MPASLNGLLQVALIIAWYAVPSMATIPWYLIFLPTLAPLVILGCVGFFALVCFAIAGIASR